MSDQDTGDLESVSSDLEFEKLEELSGGLRSVRRSQSQFEITEVQKIVPSSPSPDASTSPDLNSSH